MEPEVVRTAISGACERFASVVRSVEPATPVRGSDWSVGEVAAHVLTIATAYADYACGDSDPAVRVAHVTDDNARNLADRALIDVDQTLARLEQATSEFLDATANVPPERVMQWHDARASVHVVSGVLLGELVVHGRDIARTTGARWELSRSVAIGIVDGVFGVAPLFVDPDHASDATFEMNVRGGPSYSLSFSGGSLAVEPGRSEHPDCRIWADPRALVLVVYRRRSQWAEIGSGRLLAGGRRPWLGFSFIDRFRPI